MRVFEPQDGQDYTFYRRILSVFFVNIFALCKRLIHGGGGGLRLCRGRRPLFERSEFGRRSRHNLSLAPPDTACTERKRSPAEE